MNFDRNKMFIDEGCYAIVGVNLGIQPSTRSSHRSRVEVEQHGAAVLSRSLKTVVNVFLPLHGHDLFSSAYMMLLAGICRQFATVTLLPGIQ
jgi:hypothetical protein